jgi:hypothetical protein
VNPRICRAVNDIFYAQAVSGAIREGACATRCTPTGEFSVRRAPRRSLWRNPLRCAMPNHIERAARRGVRRAAFHRTPSAVAYGRVVVSVNDPLPLYEYTSQRVGAGRAAVGHGLAETGAGARRHVHPGRAVPLLQVQVEVRARRAGASSMGRLVRPCALYAEFYHVRSSAHAGIW